MTDESPLAIVAQHQIAPPINLEAIAADLGIKVNYQFLGNDIAGQIVRTGRNTSRSGFEISINNSEHPKRQRFTLAHEIAHFILHRDLIEGGIVDTTLYRSGMSNYLEAQANKMAADILMPIRLVKKYRELLGNDVQTLASTFDVSKAAMQIRLDALKA